MDRSLVTGVGMKNAVEQQAIPLLIDLMSARGSAEKIKAVGSDGCPSELWKYLSCLSMVVIFRIFLMRLPAMEDGRNVDSPHAPRGAAELEHIAIIVDVDLVPIQCHFRSSGSSATTIADVGHRPIHLIASNPTEVTVTGPALRTVATGPSTCKALACCLQGLGLLHRKLASKAVGCRHDASW